MNIGDSLMALIRFFCVQPEEKPHFDGSDTQRLRKMRISKAIKIEQEEQLGPRLRQARTNSVTQKLGLVYWFSHQEEIRNPEPDPIASIASHRIIEVSLEEAEQMWQSGIDNYRISQMEGLAELLVPQTKGIARFAETRRGLKRAG